MTDEPTTTEITTAPPAPPDRFALATRDLGLEPASATTLRQAFESMFSQADEWAAKAKLIRVTREDQKRDMKMARESRLALREIRVAAEHTRVRLKKDIVAQGKAIDGLANVVKALIEPIEAYLKDQETFGERAADQRRGALRATRAWALSELGADPAAYADLGALDDTTWASVLDQAKDAKEARLEAEKQEQAIRVEAERIAAERRAAEQAARAKAEAERVERERLAAEENALLRAEAEQREAAAKAEREAAAAEQRRLEAERAEASRVAREHAEARVEAEAARKEAEQRAQQGAEIAARAKAALARAEENAKQDERRRQQAEADRVAAEQSTREAAESAPDRDKLLRFAAEVRALVVPAMATPKGQAKAKQVAEQIAKMAAWIAKQGGAL